MTIDAATVDRIVTDVLKELRSVSSADDSSNGTAPPSIDSSPAVLKLSEAVITGDLLEDTLRGRQTIELSRKAILTPSAHDVLRRRDIRVIRENSSPTDVPGQRPEPAESSSLLLIVRHTPAVSQWQSQAGSSWRTELLGCPDDAASRAINAICTAEVKRVLILAEQSHRAACLANRNRRIKAAAIGHAGDVTAIRKQIRANVWCADPTGMSWFQLMHLTKAVRAAE